MLIFADVALSLVVVRDDTVRVGAESPPEARSQPSPPQLSLVLQLSPSKLGHDHDDHGDASGDASGDQDRAHFHHDAGTFAQTFSMMILSPGCILRT